MQTFKIIQPTPALKPFIRYYWAMQVSSNNLALQRTLPTGCMSLVFHRGERLKVINRDELQPRCFICGQETGFNDLSYKGNIEMIVAVFQPHTAKTFFHIPASLFRDTNISINDIEDIELMDLAKEIEDTESLEISIELIERFLLRRLLSNKDYHLAKLAAVIRNINNSVQTNIKELAAIACLSEKQFGRVFAEHIGTTPKEFMRIVRIQRALSILQHNPQIGFARLSYESGYADQSHMIKEFKIFSGYTPKEYLKICAPVSDYFS